MSIGAAPVTKDAGLEDVVRLYRGVSDRQRRTFVSVVRAAAEALATRNGGRETKSG